MLDGGSATVALHLPSTRWASVRHTARTVAASLNRNWLTRIGVLLTAAFILAALIGPLVAENPLALTSSTLQPPTWAHPFGTDNLGRDLLARSLSGARVSLFVAIMSVALGLIIALPVGLTAGFLGGTWVDDLLMGVTDVILALPLFVLALFVLGITGTGGFTVAGIAFGPAWKVVGLIGISAMPFFARVARAAALVERQEDYVNALRVVGVPRRRIVWGEILPNVLPPVIVQAFLWMAIAIFAEAGLSFLGLGIQPPSPTLGNILANASSTLLLGAWWFSVFPGVLLVVAIVGLNLVGDGLNDLLDPQVR